MSKVKIQGNASGTGVLTVTAPNTSTDRTITLPDSTGTLATTADVPAGITSSADGTAITIDSSERVGIGTGSPTARLHVYNANDHVRLSAQCAQNTGQHWQFQSRNNGEFWLRNETTSSNKFIMDATGAVTMPSQPAFLAQLASNMNNIPNQTWTTIEASTEIFDQNSDYNTSTYTFTAPVTGKYQFNAMVRMENVDNSTDYQYVVFSTDNRVYYALQTWRQTQDVSQTHHQLGILADMDANDTCRVRVYIPNGHAASDIADTTIWSGHLVC